MSVKDLIQINKDCFWDYKITNSEIQDIFNSSNLREKNILFEKIMSNSTNLLSNLSIFKKDELKQLINNYKISRFNKIFLEKRKNIVEYFFFDKELIVKELKWIN